MRHSLGSRNECVAFWSQRLCHRPGCDRRRIVCGAAEPFRRLVECGRGTRSLLAADVNDGPVRGLARRLMRHPVVRDCLPSDPVAVQCTFFRKVGGKRAGGGANWFVPWHQDVSLPCRPGIGRVDSACWSFKEGEAFVAAPAEVLETVVAVRVSLDDSREDNGPLLVWPGSHREGLLGESALNERSGNEPVVACTVPAGGTIIMRPLLVHSSRKSLNDAPDACCTSCSGRQHPLGVAVECCGSW